MPGEFEFISWLRGMQSPSQIVQAAAGDDLAILRWPAADLLLVGVDQVLDGVHFDSWVHPPRFIGAKVMNRNLSDCAAMGCLPAAAVVSAALPRSAGMDYAKELYLGMREAGENFACPIVGGDTGSWDGKLALSVTILGRSAGVEPIRRHGAKPGDKIYVTGPLGGSILGRHMTFTPRINEGRALAQSGAVTAMIDLSDGLSRDLAHICRESQVGAIVFANQIPIHEDARKLNDPHTPLDHALHDGEDYELLFTASGNPPPQLIAICIGEIVPGTELLLRTDQADTPLKAQGWEHRM